MAMSPEAEAHYEAQYFLQGLFGVLLIVGLIIYGIYRGAVALFGPTKDPAPAAVVESPKEAK